MAADVRRPSDQPEALRALTASWQLGLFVGLVTLVLGIVVSLHPTTSLNVVCVILGIVFLVAGIFRIIRSLNAEEVHRAWTAVLGLLFIIIGVLLIRHLDMTRVLVALFIGLVWIIQGVVELTLGFSGEVREGRGWTVFVGVVSLVAGIVVIAVPTSSLNVLAVLLGIWFIIMGAIEIVGALYLRHLVKHRAP